ncbi:osmotically inducible protein OsmC [Phyllobacterium sp. 1468]|uniref:OsmC family peroxiredoxin n=1 Tax=Phyllobacterium sp. 1468 TaxID=2817759 RepID=UPI002863E7B8|nr:OsmC family peroxiredoxin [Phyllobacterium sp. 1468]MDR6632608.1 osmotically inducible protein OsmC [Phyllobacterium sp. 1468]
MPIGSSTWKGTWKQGKGTISTERGILVRVPYTYASRFENAAGASPEELLAAAHAGCFNQAMANNFGMIGLEAASIETSIEVDLQFVESRPTIRSVHIETQATVPGITKEQFDSCAERSRTNCSISKLLTCDITLDARLIP